MVMMTQDVARQDSVLEVDKPNESPDGDDVLTELSQLSGKHTNITTCLIAHYSIQVIPPVSSAFACL